ncbi:MAG: serine/threonine-protein kinase, partial [Planctomycetota bacterium]
MAGSEGTEHVGRVLGGHYRLEEVLGSGTSGIVYRARHTLLDEDFAVKVLNPELAREAEVRERFLREARTLTRFAHRHAVQVRHCGEDEGLLFLVMDLCGGEPLSALLEREGRLDTKRAARIVLQVLGALGEAHAAGIVHRDLKPANIMVAAADEVRVVDFGLARILGSESSLGLGTDLTVAGTLIGTVAYMSPEQIRGEGVDGRSDLFSLGIILHEMLSGERAFGEGSLVTVMMRILEEPPEPLPREIASRIPAELRAL